MASLSDHSHTLAPIAWAGIATAIGAVVAPLDPNLLEEGIVVHTAERMVAGDHLYRDVIIHTAPLPYELLALLFRVFGAEIAVARGAVVVLQGVGTALLFAAVRRAAPAALAHAAAAAVACAPLLLVPLFSIFFYTTLAFYLCIAAVYTALRAAESTRFAVVTGVLIAAIALCKQNTGVLLAATLVPGVVLAAPAGARLARARGLVLGGAATTLLTLGLYAARGDFAALFFAQIELPLAMAAGETFGTPFINLWPLGKLDPIVQESWVMYLPSLYHMRYGLFAVIGSGAIVATQLLYALPLVVLALTALRLWPSFPRPHPLVWLHGAFLLVMTANLYPRGDWGHLVVALPPAIAQLALLAAGPPPLRWAPALAAVTLLALAVSTGRVGFWLHEIAGEPRFGPRLPLRPISRAYRTPAVPRVIDYLRRHSVPGEAIFVPRQEPLLYFATETRNPTPFEGVLPGQRELQEPLILEALEDVRFVVMSDIDQPIYTYYGDELPGVQAYLERHFEIPPDFPRDDHSWISVLRRAPDRGPTAIDLLAERPMAHAWKRNLFGEIEDAPSAPQRLAARQLNRPLAVVLGDLGGGIDFELEIPPRAVFQAGVGYRGLVSVDHQYEHPRGTTRLVWIREGDGDFERLAAIRNDDRLRAGRHWTPVEIDLSAWAGKRVTLRLETRAARLIQGDRLSWWGSPRIALPVD